MVAQGFLLQECKNLRNLLEKTLRYEYGPAGSQVFYEECGARLSSLEAAIGSTTDPALLGDQCRHLNELANLICRLERSSIGEYSWPFVRELERIATAICREDTLAGNDVPNKIYVLADGGLDTYRIHPEDRRPSYTQRRLLTIVFPKSLKHFVLLHSILGHELGHAIWRCSKHKKEIRDHVEKPIKEGHFASPDATAAHIFSANAPPEAKAFLSGFPMVTQANLFAQYASWEAWCEEILCDLFGMLIFGPSFVASECELMTSINPVPGGFGPRHPLTAWRLNYMLDGAKILGHDARPPAGHATKPQLDSFWTYMESFRQSDPWYKVFPDDQLRRALNGLKALVARHPPSEYPIPSADRIGGLVSMLINRIPPTGFRVGSDGTLQRENVDFRHILFAGWIVKAANVGMPADIINQLCEHGIMQQVAINVSLT